MLQKCSVKESVVPVFVEEDMINWIMDLISKSISDKSIHHFSLDFGSALLANIIHAPSTLIHLSAKPAYAQNVTLNLFLVNLDYVEIHEITDTSISPYAHLNMFIILIKRRIF